MPRSDELKESFRTFYNEFGGYARKRSSGEGGLRRGMRMASYVAAGLVGLVGLVDAVHFAGDNELGLRTDQYNIPFVSKQGVAERTYGPGPGMFFTLPFVTDWHTLSVDAQTVTMSADPNDGDRFSRDDLQFKTRDGNDILLNITFTYRIDPSRAPYILEHVGQSDEEIKDKVFRQIARSDARDWLGVLSSEEFYNAEQRNAAVTVAAENLRVELDEYGIILGGIDSGTFQWLNTDYENAIKQKMDADAETERLRSAYQRQLEVNARQVAQTQDSVKVMRERIDGEFNQDSVAADGYLRRAEALAEAIIEEGRNQAVGVRERREAMLSAGGRRLVEMELSRALYGKPVIQIPQMGGGAGTFQTFDMNGFLEKTGIEALVQKSLQEAQDATQSRPDSTSSSNR